MTWKYLKSCFLEEFELFFFLTNKIFFFMNQQVSDKKENIYGIGLWIIVNKKASTEV